MKKIFFNRSFTFCRFLGYAKKSQKIAYIDMEYILRKCSRIYRSSKYIESKIEKWKGKIRQTSHEYRGFKIGFSQ